MPFYLIFGWLLYRTYIQTDRQAESSQNSAFGMEPQIGRGSMIGSLASAKTAPAGYSPTIARRWYRTYLRMSVDLIPPTARTEVRRTAVLVSRHLFVQAAVQTGAPLQELIQTNPWMHVTVSLPKGNISTATPGRKSIKTTVPSHALLTSRCTTAAPSC